MCEKKCRNYLIGSFVIFLLGPWPNIFAQKWPNNVKKATFAGGCFWCMEAPFEGRPGVLKVISGFTGGKQKNPTYKEVASGATQHIEAVQIIYNEKLISFESLLTIFWRNINPTDGGGQFVDRGHQYTSAIFYHDEKQREWAEKSKKKLVASQIFKGKVVTPIRPARPFFAAEKNHQDYYKKNPLQYKTYRYHSGRDQFLKKTWGAAKKRPNQVQKMKEGQKKFVKPNKAQLKKILTPLQFHVTQEEGTETPFKNAYWDHKEEGIYVDIISLEPLFSSTDKFKSGTGWPSFKRPLEPHNITEHKDNRLFFSRTELRSLAADNHLGHLFTDGPPPTGLRYCINSAALKFIPKKQLKEYGLERYSILF